MYKLDEYLAKFRNVRNSSSWLIQNLFSSFLYVSLVVVVYLISEAVSQKYSAKCKIFTKFSGEHLFWSLYFSNTTGSWPLTV